MSGHRHLHLRLVAIAAALIAVAAAGTRAEAQNKVGAGIDLQHFRPAIDSKGLITVNASQTLGKNEVSIGLVTNYGRNVLDMKTSGVPCQKRDGEVFVAGTCDTRFAVTDIITPVLMAAYGLPPIGKLGLEIGVSAPVHVITGDRDPDFTGPGPSSDTNNDSSMGFSHQGIGDIGIHAKLRFLDTSHNKFGVAALVSAYMPSGDDKKFAGSGDVVIHPQLILDTDPSRGRLKLAANVGARIHGKKNFVDDQRPDKLERNPEVFDFNMGETPATGKTLSIGTEVTYSEGLAYAITKRKVDFILEGFGTAALGGDNSDFNFPVEGIAGLKVYLAANSFLEFGGGFGIPGMYGAAQPRLFLGIIFEPTVGDRDNDGFKDDVDQCPDDPEDFDDFKDKDGCPEPDNDRDGILDVDDDCPLDPEDKDGNEDEDGCPEGEDLDRDRDGLKDSVDKCPDDPEDKDQFEDEDGCPDPDTDQDGILDVDDLCPNDPEDKDNFEDDDGCPDNDHDKDRILDKDDSCPNEPETYNGNEDEDGCPDRGRVIVNQGNLEILDKIYFETAKAIIKPESFPILDAVAATMKGNPQITLIEIQGHADERGDDDYNLRLTDDRAHSVKRYLIEHGVEESRLTAKGYGETRPISPGHNEAAWSKNRRVEFVILGRSDSP